MSRRRSSVLLPFNATATRTGIHTSNIENVTLIRSRSISAKRRRTQFEIPDSGRDADNSETCEVIKGKTWIIHRVSDLNKFDYRTHTFTKCSRELSRRLVDSFSEDALTLKTKIEECAEIPGFEGDGKPVHIKIEDERYENPRVIYEGFLIPSPERQEHVIEGTVRLPLLLARGSKVVRDKAHECLANLFSAAIQEVAFPAEDMRWMIAAWSGYINESRTSKEVEFLYYIPTRTDTIKCAYPVEFIKNLWSCVHDQNNRVVELVEVKRFHESLIKHVTATIGLNLAAVPLKYYKTPDFELEITGKVKVKTADFIPRILHFITDLCQSRTRNDFNPV